MKMDPSIASIQCEFCPDQDGRANTDYTGTEYNRYGLYTGTDYIPVFSSDAAQTTKAGWFTHTTQAQA